MSSRRQAGVTGGLVVIVAVMAGIANCGSSGTAVSTNATAAGSLVCTCVDRRFSCAPASPGSGGGTCVQGAACVEGSACGSGSPGQSTMCMCVDGTLTCSQIGSGGASGSSGPSESPCEEGAACIRGASCASGASGQEVTCTCTTGTYACTTGATVGASGTGGDVGACEEGAACLDGSRCVSGASGGTVN